MVSESETTDPPDPLEQCISRVTAAAVRLEAALETEAFPALTDPRDDRAARERVDAARQWWKRIERAHGSPAGFHSASRIIRDVPIESRSLYWHFDPEFQPQQAINAWHARAADVFGSFPAHLVRIPSPFFSTILISHSSELLPDEQGLNTIPVTASNWPRVRLLLEYGRELVRRHCAAVVAWVRSRSAGISSPTAPKIAFVGWKRRGSAELAISVHGRTRHLQVTRTELLALRELKKRGRTGMDRGKKSGLLRKIPELREHLTADQSRGTSGQRTTAIYALSEACRQGLQIPAEP